MASASEQLAQNMNLGVFAKAKAAKFGRIDDSRRFIMLDQPEKFAEAVERFLSQ